MKEKEKTNGGYKVVNETTRADKIYRTIMLVVLVAFITFFLTTILMYSYFSEEKQLKTLASFFSKDVSDENTLNKMQELKKVIDKYYLKDVNEEELEEGALKGYIEGLNDQYTEYISKEEMEEYTEDINGEFVGVGIYMVQDKGTNRVKILAPIKNQSAEQAGIKAGDLIKSVDDVEYAAEQIKDVTNALKGEEGTEVKLVVLRGEEELEFKLKREKIKIAPVKSEILENNIGYIEFSSFDQDTAKDFKAKYEELKNQGIKSLIIDLRNNGGGIVDEATEIVGTILPKESTVLYEVDKNGNEEEIKTSEDPIIDVPIVVLVNENTASSSEIMAAALKENEKAKIVGKKTFGKGIIQILLSLPDGSGIKITAKEYLTPKRNKINEVGIEPDETVELPEDVKNVVSVEREKDTQLQRAIEILK